MQLPPGSTHHARSVPRPSLLRLGSASARASPRTLPLLPRSNGRPTAGNAAYGATKRALVQLKDSLAVEARGSGVGVHIFSPGAP